eukprot:COSAG01_NODE_408_length_17382_cov_6.231431_9_plen_140_part_00
MSLKELLALAPGGTGGRGGPSAHEDQSAGNGWRDIAVLEGHGGGTRSRTVQSTVAASLHTPAFDDPQPSPGWTPKAEGDFTGNRIVDVAALDDWMQQNSCCPECAAADNNKAARDMVILFSQKVEAALLPNMCVTVCHI